jgi:pyruvate kinase
MRPKVPIVAFTPDPASAARLALSHGVVARPCAVLDATADRIGALGRLLDATGLIRRGATVVLVTSTATPGSGPTLVGIHRVGEAG